MHQTDFRFRKIDPDFRNDWPAVLHASNGLYDVTLYYTGDYERDRAERRLSAERLTLSSKCTDPFLTPNIGLRHGQAVLDCGTMMPELDIPQARLFLGNADRALNSAEALQEFIRNLFEEDSST